ncbi:hypothetical protein O6H91_04G021600 [Diphasiastrum complanatum]|uniref:Uncharacterized protein n=1 Tax=Diphasiastrum complanatum TaxID=34168 RepID=A0ACC2DUN6_DIPCM|nr:hypothetical protein O6H91_Y320600 [Diphasiastrum complanatum]KAJ7558014.1 hypothetical protein O6H91_04G021600 [Diphasiastrum complanatum]
MEEMGARKVVVGLDHSEQSLYALQWALENLVDSDLGDNIVLLHSQPQSYVFRPFVGLGVSFASEFEHLLNKYQDESLQKILEQAKNLCVENRVEAKTHVVHGDPRDTVCDIVNEMNADVLVMGSHGDSCPSIRRAFLGSVCDFCAHNARCPVLIVKKTP